MAEFCKKCWLKLNKELTADQIVETADYDYCEKCGAIGKVVAGVLKTNSNKGANSMANTKNNRKPAAPAAGSGNNGFQPTFRKYQDMTDTEKAAFRQGAKTSENKVKERLGFTKPKN